jgi:hypothetical protein
MGSLVRRGGWGCGVLGWVTNKESVLLFPHPAQQFGHYQDSTCLGHQRAETGIELKFGSHLGDWEETKLDELQLAIDNPVSPRPSHRLASCSLEDVPGRNYSLVLLD